MGVSGSGKTTLGRLLASKLNCSFLEGDDFHCTENIKKMTAGTPLTDTDRIPWLKRISFEVQPNVNVFLCHSRVQDCSFDVEVRVSAVRVSKQNVFVSNLFANNVEPFCR